MSFLGRTGVALAVFCCSALQILAADQVLSVPGPPPVAEEPEPGFRETLEPEDELSLRQAVALALLRSPDLAAFAWEVRAREARVIQAGAHPNPELGLLVEELGTNREEISGGEQTTIQLGLLVELGGKRSARTQVASLERDVAGWDHEINRINLLSLVSHSFIEVLSAQRRVALAEETVRLADQSAGVVSERVKGGKASPVEETKATVVLATARIRLDRTRRELEASRRALSGTWGSTTPHFKAAVGDLDSIPPVPDLEQLTTLLTQNPELARWATEVSLRRATVDLEKTRRVPDLTMDGGYKHHSAAVGEDADTYLVGISIPLPLFNRNRGGIQAARHRAVKSEEERRSTEVRLGIALAESYNALSSAYSRVTALRDTVLPGAQSAFDAVSEGYRLGRFGLLDVLDSQRTLFEARHEYLRAATDYHKAVVDVEHLIGDRLDSTATRRDGDLP